MLSKGTTWSALLASGEDDLNIWQQESNSIFQKISKISAQLSKFYPSNLENNKMDWLALAPDTISVLANNQRTELNGHGK